MYPDFLTCGLCADEFPLSQIMDFIRHKISCLQTPGGHSLSGGDSGAVLSLPELSCVICQQDFHTARGVLQHVQSSHSMNIVQHRSAFSAFQHSFLNQSPQVPSAAAVPVNACGAESRPELRVATATTVSDTHSTTVSHIPDDVSVSPSEGKAMPVTCAKLASTDGTTICCSGKECHVTITPPCQRNPPPKKCCSSVVPKKRTRHMQEHDSEDMEQCALETLVSLHRRLMSQKCRPGQKKARKSTKSPHSRKSQCVMSCEGEVVCKTKAAEESEAEAQEEERGCRVVEEGVEGGEDSSSDCHSAGSSCRGDPQKSKIEIYSVEKDSVTNRKTVIMNSGMTVTVQPTETSAGANKTQDSPAAPATQVLPSVPCDQSVPSKDASRESAQILAELMYHSSQPGDQSLMMPIPSLQTTVGEGQIPLTASLQNSLAEQAVSDLLPMDASISSTHAMGFSSSLCPMFVSTNLPSSMDMPLNVAAPALPPQGSGGQPLDLHQLPDLDSLTASIQSFPALDHIHQLPAGLSVQETPVSAVSVVSGPGSGVSMVNVIAAPGSGECSGHDTEGRMISGGKKRRYPTSRPYKCTECDQAFNQPIHLKKHMSKHTGVKPFKCENCEYSTVERSHLKAHNRIHTGEKPFQCQFCTYATAQNSTLKVHLRRHHQDRQTAAAATTSAPDQQK